MSQRKKSRNFTEKEKLHLIAIVDRYKHIVENKATDGTTIKAKLVAWQNIAEEYNVNCESEIRIATQLKALYKNIKAKIRKDVAVDNVKYNEILKIQKITDKRNIGVQVEFETTDIKPSLSPIVDLEKCDDVVPLDLNVASPTSSVLANRKRRSPFPTEYNIKKLYLERKLQFINFQLKSAKIQHSIDMKIKRATLKKLEALRVTRAIPDRRDPFILYSDREFKLRYRFCKENVIIIKNRLGNMEPPTHRNKPLSGMLQLLLTLRFYATGSFQQLLGNHINVSRSTACRVIRRVSERIAALKSDYIYMPRPDEIIDVKEDFYNISQFPGVIGAVDCTYVRIQSPGGADAEHFRNRKGYFSFNIQAVCDSKLRIRNIISRWPGSVQDWTIFNDTPLRAEMESGHFGTDSWLLGDNEYPCMTYLLTPLLDPATPSEKAYNRNHLSTQSVIESCFKIVKQRFPCLNTGLRNKVETAVVIIVACAVLHNIAIELQDDDDFDDVIDIQDEEEVDYSLLPHNARDENTSARTKLIGERF